MLIDFSEMSDPDLFQWRARVLPDIVAGVCGAELGLLFEASTDEIVRRAREAWLTATEIYARLECGGARSSGYCSLSDWSLWARFYGGRRGEKGTAVDVGKEFHEFERTYFERLRLAAQVILEAAPDLGLVTDPLEVELHIFRERVEFLLLLPEYSEGVIPWRRMLNGEDGPDA